MLDRFVYGGVDRVSPEAPIPVLRVDRQVEMLGGAGNVAANALALGAAVSFIAVVGDDEPGALLGQIPAPDQAAGLTRHLLVEPGRPTTIKTRFVAGTQQLLRADQETSAPITARTEDLLIQTVGSLLAAPAAADGAAQVLVLSDYGKGVLTKRVLAELIQAARAAGVPVLVDPKGSDYGRYRGATAVTPNRKELEQAAGRTARADDEVVDAARLVLARDGLEAIVATRSEQGLSVVTAGSVAHRPANAREIFDVSGAGDTVMATLAAALSVGGDLVDAATLANLAGGIAVAKPGTATVSVDELLHALDEASGSAGKHQPLATLVGRVDGWRRRGLTVAFTNGCFDLLHPGHIHLLRQARGTADRLIVGLNTDASVQRLKGPTRPVQNEHSRALVLSSLADVDAVVLFGEDTPLELIKALRPDVLVKGADYTVEQIVGHDIVESYGGKIVRAELVPDMSTTKTIAKMAVR